MYLCSSYVPSVIESHIEYLVEKKHGEQKLMSRIGNERTVKQCVLKSGKFLT